MGTNRKLQFAVRAALAAAAAAAVVPAAWSQQAAVSTTPAASAGLEEVVVTGSRITSPNLTAISPITSVDAGYIGSTNLTRVEDILNNLPMVFAGQNSTVSNGADGTASVNLRGLGANRTLVLVNGRRLGPGQGTGTNVSDLNEIPAALIERVDILTGGASSVYGADAVAGVVNFVLNTHFEGVKIDTSYSFYNHSNNNSTGQGALALAGDPAPANSVNTGFGKNVSVLMGSNFADNKGNATFYFTYDRAAAILQAKYDYSGCVLDARRNGSLTCGGSATSAKNGAGGYFQAYGSAPFTNTVDGKTGAFRPYDGAVDSYNFGPLNFYQRPNERFTGGSFLNYNINDHVNVYGELMWARNTSDAQIAPSGDFFTATNIPCTDPLLTPAETTAICNAAAGQGNPGGNAALYIGRRNVEGGGRIASFVGNTFRALTGVKGDIIDGLTFDVYAQRDSTDTMLRNLNYFGADRVANALNVISGPALMPNGNPNPLAGQPECASVYDGTAPACVPWNIWVPNGVTAAATNYLSIPLLVDATTVEYVVSGSVTADMGKWNIKSPFADEGIKINVGSEYRSESAEFSPDLATQQGNAEGSAGAILPIAGNYHVKEVFTEVGIPLLEHKPMAESLGLELGYRYSDYTLGFKTNTYKIGAEWAPVSDFRVRGSYSRAVRAPNIAELFAPQSVLLDGTKDPCAGPTPTATLAQCLLTGMTQAQYTNHSVGANPASQYQGLLGGNSHLTPEKSDTYSAGIVFTPSFLHNFSASLDYFNIKLVDTIGAIGGDVIIGNCIATGAPVFCNAIHRDANGSLFKTTNGFITDTNVNFGSLTTRGVDVKVNYRLPMDTLGSLLFNLEGTRLINLGTQPLTGGPAYDCAGYFGATCGAPNTKWRHVFNTTWATPWSGFNMTARWRFLSGADSQHVSPDPQLAGNAFPLTQHIKPFSYFDLSTDISLYKTFKLQLGANNVLDKDPPIIASSGTSHFPSDCPAITPNQSSCNGNTFPGTYDALGRFFFARVTAQF